LSLLFKITLNFTFTGVRTTKAFIKREPQYLIYLLSTLLHLPTKKKVFLYQYFPKDAKKPVDALLMQILRLVLDELSPEEGNEKGRDLSSSVPSPDDNCPSGQDLVFTNTTYHTSFPGHSDMRPPTVGYIIREIFPLYDESVTDRVLYMVEGIVGNLVILGHPGPGYQYIDGRQSAANKNIDAEEIDDNVDDEGDEDSELEVEEEGAGGTEEDVDEDTGPGDRVV